MDNRATSVDRWHAMNSKPLEVLIAIQARSTSTRFPRKIFAPTAGKRMLDWVIDVSRDSATWVSRHSRTKINCRVAVLYPTGDSDIVRAFKSDDVLFVDGDEHDVLSRYLKAQKQTDADYIVRLTSDCPLSLDYMISKHINLSTIYSYDYLNNSDEDFRFVADGYDVEVLSARALDWLSINATSPEDREHVTTAIKRVFPKQLAKAFVYAKVATMSKHLGPKMSVDTQEDLDRVNSYLHELEYWAKLAKLKYGDPHVYAL